MYFLYMQENNISKLLETVSRAWKCHNRTSKQLMYDSVFSVLQIIQYVFGVHEIFQTKVNNILQ